MRFDDFIKKGEVRKASIDTSLIKSIIEFSKKDLLFLNTIKLNGYAAQKLMTNYYDVLRSILEAIALKKGFKIYNHEAFTYFLREQHEELIAVKFDSYKKIYYAYLDSIEHEK